MRKLPFACVSSLLFHQILCAAPGSFCQPVKSLNLYFCLLNMNSITQLPQDTDRAVVFQPYWAPIPFPHRVHRDSCTDFRLDFKPTSCAGLGSHLRKGLRGPALCKNKVQFHGQLTLSLAGTAAARSIQTPCLSLSDPSIVPAEVSGTGSHKEGRLLTTPSCCFFFQK